MRKFLLLVSVFVFVLTSAWAQERTVSGTVTSSEDGSSLPGVNIVLKGTTTGTVTDVDGNYKLNVPEEGGTLVFTFIGLATQEIEIGARSVIDLQMAPDLTQLSEVVITAVGIEANKANLGYSVQSVQGDAVQEAKQTNLVSALNSKVAGVWVNQSSGSPGASTNIRIRGATSVNGANQPLFVIDGVPVNNQEFGNGTGGVDQSNRLIDVNPQDIESLTVLKGPAATGLYGIRAANGAVIITTKKGSRNQKPKITLSSTLAFDEVNKMHDFQYEFSQGSGEVYNGPWTAQGSSFGVPISDLGFFDGIYDDVTGQITDRSGNVIDPAVPAEYLPPAEAFFGGEYGFDNNGFLVPSQFANNGAAQGYDKVDNFFVTGTTYDNTLSISGGTQSTNYFVSAGWLSSTGVVPGADFDRKSFRATIQSELSERVELGASAVYTNSGGDRIQRGSNISGIMLGLLRTTPTFDNANGLSGREALAETSTYVLPDGSQRAYRYRTSSGLAVYDNPFWIASRIPFSDNVNRVIGYLNPVVKVTDWLKVSYKLGVDSYSEDNLNAFDIGSATQPTGQIVQLNRVNSELNSDLLILINKELNQDFNLGATIGHNYFSRWRETRTATGIGMAAPTFFDISNTAAVQATNLTTRRKLYGVYADIKLDWQNKVFLNVLGRNDWSSTLPQDGNSFFYPAVSLGVDVTELAGISNNVLSYLKVRGSWGQVGNDSPFLYATTNTFTSAFIGGDGFITGITFPVSSWGSGFERGLTKANQNLEPETTTTIEAGFEAKLFQGRLNIDFTWYDSESDGQILGVNVAPSTGFFNVIQNGGVITNTGIEILVEGTPLQLGDFAWDVTVNFTQFDNIVESLPEEIGENGIGLAGFVSLTSRAAQGQAYGALFGRRFDRVETGPNAGRLIIGSNGWPNQAPTDGFLPDNDPNPDFLMGIENAFSYKGIRVSALLDIRQGGYIWNGTRGVTNFFGVTEESAENRGIEGYVFDGVQVLGDGTEVENNVPVDFGQARYQRYAFGGLTEESIEDGSWVRLRNATISYQLPSSLFQNSNWISGASVSIYGNNLFLITEYTGVDPEVNLTGATNGFGLEYFGMPNTRTYGATVRLEF